MSTAVVLYPWGDIVHRRTGAGLRVGQLIDHLADRCERVVVVATADHTDAVVGNVEYRFIRPDDVPARPTPRSRRRDAALSALRAGRWPMRIAVNPRVDALEFFRRYDFGRALEPQLRAAVDEADVVFCEYPFWARALVPLARDAGVPVVLTVYDVLSRTFGVADPDGERLLLAEELWALGAADHAYCVSGDDQRFFASHGVEPRCIPNPIDVERCHVEPRQDVLDDVRARYGLDGPICLFIGSLHPPNNEAASLLEHMAPSAPEVQFVIAGTCAPPGRAGNLVKLGEISNEDRRALYALADLVTIPLRRGTGSSLKTIEALAYGRPVLATTVGARGYGVEDGRHLVISDNIGAYPSLIRALLANDERRASLAREGRSLAQRYDFRTSYDGYDEVLPCAAATAA